MTEREWREAVDLKPATFWLVTVLVAAAVLRFWRLGAGIPHALGVDEHVIVERVLAIMRTGDFNPHFFDYPGLAYYLHLPVACLRVLVGALRGEWGSLADAPSEAFYLWGRTVTATLGTATAFLVHQIAMRWGARHALLATALFAVMPMHVRESHFLLTDVPATFFVTLTPLLSLRAHEMTSARAFAWAGVAAGLATATKYPAGTALLLPLVAAWMTLFARPSRLACVVATIGGFAGAYLLAAPYTVLDLPGFLNGFAYLVSHYRDRDPSLGSGWLFYLGYLRFKFGWPAALLAGWGFGLGVVRAIRGPGRVRWTLLVVFPLVFLWSIAGRQLIYPRYSLPMVPFLCVLAAIAVVSGVSLLRRFSIPRTPRTILIVALTVAALLPPAIASIQYLRDLGRPTTSEQAYAWLLTHAPTRARVVVERYGVMPPTSKFRVDHVTNATRLDFDALRADKDVYLVLNSVALDAPQAHPRAYQAYRALLEAYPELTRFASGGRTVGPTLVILKVQ
jgi:4-amino-4-deoxy-L-arabinose transferase-like glycosyltransferase